MRVRHWLPLATAVLVTGSSLLAQGDREPAALAVLRSSAATTAKQAACRELKRCGGAPAVPGLVAVLGQADLVQWAVDALQANPAPEAGAALRAALTTAAGPAKALLLAALAERGDPAAVTDLTQHLADADPLVAAAAARGLGRLGGPRAIAALRQRLAAGGGGARPVVTDALLACAEQALAAGQGALAADLYRSLSTPEAPEAVRVAVFRGLVLSSGDQAAVLVTSALTGTDAALQPVAVELARGLRGSEATTRMAAAVAGAAPATQVALLAALAQRGDAAAVPAVLAVYRAGEPAVRVAALKALGELGDADLVPLLAATAAGGVAGEREAARRALSGLRHGEVLAALLGRLDAASAPERVELIGVLARRGESRAVPVLLRLAAGRDREVGAAAAVALGKLADERHLDALLALLVRAGADAVREDALAALVATGLRCRQAEAFATAALAAMPKAKLPTRCALLLAAGQLGGPGVLAAQRAAAASAEPALSAAGIQSLAETAGLEALTDLLSLARQAPTPELRQQALRGYWRVVGQTEDRPAGERLKLCQDGLQAAQRAEERRLGLSELAKVPHEEALRLADTLRADAAVRAEAEAAVLQLATRLISAQRGLAAESIAQLAKEATSEPVRAAAGAAQAALAERSDYLEPWLVSGPYREAGKECQALFEVRFAPERPEGAKDWSPAPAPARLADHWWVDLDSVVGGNHCVVYLVTRVWAPAAEAVRLAIGTDDGIKLWVNGGLVHANNAVRGFTADQDRATARLQAGWNEVLAKVTQHTMGCALSVRVRRANGQPVPGLRCDPQAKATVPQTPMTTPTATLPKPEGYRKLKLYDRFVAEGATAADVNRDGKLDVIAGPYWYEGPSFERRHEYRPAKVFDPNGYSDNFLTFTGDFNGDGWPDILVVPFPGEAAYWYQNPAGRDQQWAKRPAYGPVGNESPGWGDVNGDGRPELLCCNDGYLGFVTWDPAKPDQAWRFHAVSGKDGRYQRFTHGLGYGDINGDGRADVLEAAGWWEQPATGAGERPWRFHPVRFAEAAAQLLVCDVDGDGVSDVVTAWHCHHYGLVWHRQLRRAGAESTWERHDILSATPNLADPALRVSQLHALTLADMNGDGLPDIVTGKRWWAHGATGDVEPDAPAAVLWFELGRDGRGGVTWRPHVVDDDSGVGTQVSTADLNGDGRPDVIVANKRGVFVHLSQPAR